MSIIIDGTGTISGVSSTGLTTAQNVGYAQLPTGSVLQVVNNVYSTQVNISTQTLTSTGLTATITPKFSTSKILVLVTQPIGEYATTASQDVGITFALQRNGSNIYSANPILYFYSPTSNNYQTISLVNVNYLDSPATTSATTYTTYFANFRANSSGSANYSNQSSVITLMEIAG